MTLLAVTGAVPPPAAAAGTSDVFVGIEPYATHNQANNYFLPAGQEVVLAGFVANRGPDPVTNLSVEVVVPEGVDLISATPSQGTFDPQTNVWTLGTLGVVGGDASPDISLRVARTSPGEHQLQLRAITPDQTDPYTPDNVFTATMHEPVTRWAAPGAPAVGECLTKATACDLRYAADNPPDGIALPGDTVRLLPGDYPLSTGLSVAGSVSLVGDDPLDKPRIINTGIQTLLTFNGALIADLEIVDTTTVENNSALSIFPSSGTTIERVVIRSSRRAVAAQPNLTIRDTLLVGDNALGVVRHVASGAMSVQNTTVINTSTGPAVQGDASLYNTIARSAGAVDLQNVSAATRSNFGSSTNGVAPGSGDNQTDPPVFVDVANGDYHQAAGSPTIDAGSPVVVGDRRDVDGGARIAGQAVDIGADERGPVALLRPTSHDFGDQSVGTSSAVRTFTLTNLGTEDLSVSSASLGGADPTQFTISRNTCTSPTSPQAACELDVRFAPTSPVARSATLELVTNAGAVSSSLTGRGTAPAISVSPGSLAFADQRVGTSSSARTLNVRNTGNAALSVGATQVTGTDANQFEVTRNTCTSALAPDAACELDVRFSPTTAGAKSAQLSIPSTASGSPTLVPLSGKGTAEVRSTTLKAGQPNPIGQLLPLMPTATLTDTQTGTPLPGMSITFTVRGRTLCSGTTDAQGVARCGSILSWIQVLLAGRLDASFAGLDLGSVVFAPSSDTVRVLGR